MLRLPAPLLCARHRSFGRAPPAAPPRSPGAAAPRGAHRRRAPARPSAASQTDVVVEKAKEALKVLSPLVDAASDLVPASVPRPAAKVGVSVLGGGVVFALLSSLLNTAFTLLVLASLAFVAYTINREGGGKGGSGGGSDGDADDPLEAARRIMDKYK